MDGFLRSKSELKNFGYFLVLCQFFSGLWAVVADFWLSIPVHLGFGGLLRGLWAVVGSCGRFPVFMGFLVGLWGVSLGNHYPVLVQNVWLRLVKCMANEGLLSERWVEVTWLPRCYLVHGLETRPEWGIS